MIDDEAVKSLDVKYPPDKGGPRALVAYTGLAELPDGTKTGDWLRETLRGETEAFDDSMAHLRRRLNRDMAQFREPLIVNALVVHGERRYFGGLSNMKRTKPGGQRVIGSFGYVMKELDVPFWFANGYGALAIARKGMAELIGDQLEVRPRKVEDHMNLLASINRKVSQLDKTVSPYCHVGFLNGSGDHSGKSKIFTSAGESILADAPIVLFGIDLTPMMRRIRENFDAMNRGETVEDMDVDAMNEEIKRRP